MPSWTNLQNELNQVELNLRGNFIAEKSRQVCNQIATHYNRNVLYYASGFLQKPQVPGLYTSINMEDINGFMAGIHGHDFEKNLLLILHTPGGMAEAAQTIVDYLRSKFEKIDVAVPTYAMSAGTMIALGGDRILMGKQSQLGPTDPQLIQLLISLKKPKVISVKIPCSHMLGLRYCDLLVLPCFKKRASPFRMVRQ